MFLVIGLNNDEFGRGIDRPVHRFNTEKAMLEFISRFNGDISRLEIYEATKRNLNLRLD